MAIIGRCIIETMREGFEFYLMTFVEVKKGIDEKFTQFAMTKNVRHLET